MTVPHVITQPSALRQRFVTMKLSFLSHHDFSSCSFPPRGIILLSAPTPFFDPRGRRRRIITLLHLQKLWPLRLIVKVMAEDYSQKSVRYSSSYGNKTSAAMHSRGGGCVPNYLVVVSRERYSVIRAALRDQAHEAPKPSFFCNVESVICKSNLLYI